MSKFKGYVIAAVLAVPALALAASESEPNNPIASAEALPIAVDAGQTTGGATLDGVVGNLAGSQVGDLDYFSFEGKEGDVVTIDIDGGMGGLRDVDTILGVFDTSTFALLRQSNNEATDPGSVGIPGNLAMTRDARIINFKLPATAKYIVGVSSGLRMFKAGGGVTTTILNSLSNGDYTLIISGVSPALLQINIDIKPGSQELAPINPKSRGKIPVALLGGSDFSVFDVDTDSLTFGHSGAEASLAKCGEPTDVNDDLWKDLVCHFENQDAKFAPTDTEAILRGSLKNGSKFEGRGWLKMVPASE